LRLAGEGRTVALVSSGDAGVYGMAGLVLELSPPENIEVVIVPGVSAVQAAAAVLGAPLMHDFAVISLSDLLTPWELIEKRLAAVAAADFVVALYNPRSKGESVISVPGLLLVPFSTPVDHVRNACRQTGQFCTWQRCLETSISFPDHHRRLPPMLTGRADITPRGYKTG
jgi:adenosylcobyric acid synthase